MSDFAPRQGRRGRLSSTIDLVVAGLRLRWRRYAIADRSMRPAIDDGDWVIGIANPSQVRVGDVVVCDLPSSPGFSITKRVTSIDPSTGGLWLLGDNPDAGSVDSRSFGAIPPEHIDARLVVRYRPLPPSWVR